MATYTAAQLSGSGTPTEVLSGAKTFTLSNPLSSSAYFTVETVRNATGSYADQPTNALGTYASFTGIDSDTLITSSYISSVVLPSGASSYQFTPSSNRKSELAYDAKLSFRVGDMVGIDHKKINPNDTFRVIKINSKNIKVQGDGGSYTVAPSLLVKKTFTTEVYS